MATMVKCPTCRRPVQWSEESVYRPFCTERCGLIDLGSWFNAHLAVIVAFAIGTLVVIVAVVALMLWIGSRATFVYIDDVATGRAEVSRPWSAHAERANSYFAWRFGLAAAFLGG